MKVLRPASRLKILLDLVSAKSKVGQKKNEKSVSLTIGTLLIGISRQSGYN